MKRLLVPTLVFALIACNTSTPPVKLSTLPGPSAIQGMVVDDMGGSLPGVTVTATDSRGGSRTAVTDSAGKYAINGIAAGSYVVTATLAGMRATSAKVTVERDKITFAELTLRLATVAESITVTAAAPMTVNRERFTFDGVEEVGAAAAPMRVGATTAYAEPLPPERPQYAAFEDHGFIDTATQRVTTFAIDVDRASYANIRRFLSNRQLPPRDAVRIEEMVNYFTYDYPQPAGDVPFSITSEVAGCPWNAASRLLRIGIQGRNLDEWKMAPNNLVFLIDVSGSMDIPQSLPLIKQALPLLVDRLRPEDRVSIVVYASAEGLVLPSTSGADKRTILRAIKDLQSGGATAGAAGIELAYKVAQENFIKGGNNRVILCTDGDFNVGTSSIPELQALIEKKRETGVFLSTIGVGMANYQDALMETLADKGNGNYNYLDTLKEAEKVFKRELTGTLVTIAKDVKVQLDFDPAHVASYRQIGYENRAMKNEDFKDDTKDAGELGAGHSVTALYEIVPAASSRGQIGTIALRYKQPDGDTSSEVNAVIVDEGRSVYQASPDMQFAAAVAELGMLLRDSQHKGTASWDDVAALVRQSRGADLDGMRGEFGTLVETAMLLRGTDRLASRD
jgi:Ca-activated chloride channel family protein